MSLRAGETRLNPVRILFLYDQRRLLGLLAALRLDPLAIQAFIVLVAVLLLGGAWALASHVPPHSPVLAAQLGLAVGVSLTLSLKPLSVLRAGPFAELGDDGAAVFAWLCGRTAAGLAAVMTPLAAAALLMGWRPGQTVLLFVAAAAAGIGSAAALRLYWPAVPVRLPSIRLSRSGSMRQSASRAFRLSGIELSRRGRGLPAGLSAVAGWLAALLIGLAGTEPRLGPVVDGASALLVFFVTVQALRFDAATVRLLAFEPNSLFDLARDLFGVRLAVAVVAGALVALVAAPVAAFGLALGVGLRALEFLHGVRRAAAAPLLAQVEIALVLVIALVAGPAALAWIAARSAWLYRRADQSMGLT